MGERNESGAPVYNRGRLVGSLEEMYDGKDSRAQQCRGLCPIAAQQNSEKQTAEKRLLYKWHDRGAKRDAPERVPRNRRANGVDADAE